MKKILAFTSLLLLLAANAYPNCQLLEITDEGVPDGFVNEAYSFQMSAYGGTTPYTWSIYSGSLPAGLSLSSGGLISGTPTTAGFSEVYIRVTDSANPACTNTRAYHIWVW